MDFNTYSCFQNFVPVIKYGIPQHSPTHNSILHLNKLLREITNKIKPSLDKVITIICFMYLLLWLDLNL